MDKPDAVEIEITKEMIDAGRDVFDDLHRTFDPRSLVVEIYKAMRAVHRAEEEAIFNRIFPECANLPSPSIGWSPDVVD